MDKNMPRYATERKATVLKSYCPPAQPPIPEIAQAEDISEATLYNWLKQAREEGRAVPGSGKPAPKAGVVRSYL